MFGTNKVLGKTDYDPLGQTLTIQSIFPTIQGEGPFAGRPAVFLRLAGCNMRCYFCDTDFESRMQAHDIVHVARLIHEAARKDRAGEIDLVVITGGEPLLQNIVPLLDILCEQMRYEVQIETAGTVWVEGLERHISSWMLTIVCSPKTGKVHPKIAEYCYDWKYLIMEGGVSTADGLPNMSTQEKDKKLLLYRSPCRSADTIWLQPCEAYKVDYNKVKLFNDGTQPLDGLRDQQLTSFVRDEEQTRRNVKLCTELAMTFNYRVSIQTHKILGVP